MCTFIIVRVRDMKIFSSVKQLENGAPIPQIITLLNHGHVSGFHGNLNGTASSKFGVLNLSVSESRKTEAFVL